MSGKDQSLKTNVRWYSRLIAAPDVVQCVILSLPAATPTTSKAHGSGRSKDLPQGFLFALYRNGRVAYAAVLAKPSDDTDKIADACLKIRDRPLKTIVDTRLGRLKVGPDNEEIKEFESTWRNRTAAPQNPDPDNPAAKSALGIPRRPVHDAIHQFESELDATWLDVCPVGFPQHYRAYNWLQRQDAPDRTRFMQAVQAYPFLWNLLLELRSPGAEALRQRIRDAAPIAGSLCELLGATTWQLKALREAFVSGLIDDRDIEGYDHLLAHVRALDHLKPEQVPKTDAGWEYLASAMDQLHFKSWMGDLAQAGLDALAGGKGVATFWRPFTRKKGLRAQMSALEDFLDYAARFPEQNLLPADSETSLRSLAGAYARWKVIVDPQVLAYYYDQALPFWLRKFVRAPWEPMPLRELHHIHHEPAEQDSQLQSEPVLAGHWPPLLPRATTVDGFKFVELTTAEALREEGYEMRHCVGKYGERCEVRGVRVFSVRQPSGERVSTLALWHAGGLWRIDQHFGKANSKPSIPALRTAEKLVALVNDKVGA